MIIRTKKTRITPSTYIRLGLLNILRQHWWISLPTTAAAIGLFFMQYTIASIIVASLPLLYMLFWWTQFYSLTKLEENQLMFERLFYELNDKHLILFLNTKQGMPIEWKQVTSARHGKDYFLLFISKAQFIYLPYSAFQGEQQIKLVDILLRNKKIL